jgi:hypothetical protein
VNRLTTRARTARTRIYDPTLVAQVAVAVVALGAVLLAAHQLALPPRTEVTVANDTAYDVDVVVHAPDQHGVVVFGRVGHGLTRSQPHLIDVGDDWVFSFRHGGDELGELRMSRQDLEGLDHRVDVPADVARRAQDLGFHPAPDR